ncbi:MULTISPECIES: DUF7344 domain-containing protein [Haloprofundus]|uniref:DUF7344 domain-containing protein n=1 Tax=Haloprofundus TaxID=1911573 RepID=UPI000E44AC05|nr:MULTISPECIES: hypothetical protein [Haloprofundus]QCJ47486.1 hypothetical protein FCF25_10310 [Haloprofundus sp. MHR1]
MAQKSNTEAVTTSRLLSSQRRVHALLALREAEAAMTLPVLVYETALREVDSPSDVTEDHLERVEITLRHVHLPKLAEFEVIRHDPDDERVSLTDDVETLESIIEAVF